MSSTFRGPLRGALHGAVVVLALLYCTRAEARILEFYVDGYGGGLYAPKHFAGHLSQDSSNGMGGMPTTGSDFFEDQSGGLLGLRAGIEFFFTDFYLQFDQFFNTRGAAGSAIQAMLGWDFHLGDDKAKWQGLLGIYGGMVFGFPYSPHFPIDNSQIAGIGVAAEAQAGAEYNINPKWVVQMMATAGYHYMFAGARTITLDNMGGTDTTTTHGIHLLLKVGIRFHLFI